jgi:cyclopropane fatty-acyl-phospholipid synthase-like methyltransferase
MVEKTAAAVTGTWARYFESLNLGYWTPETAQALNDAFTRLYGDFHEKNLGPHPKVLEIGVGSGGSAISLTNKGFKVIGFDNDREALKMAQFNKQFSSKPENLHLLVADFYRNLPFTDQSFSACVSYGLFEHFTEQDLPALITEQFRVAPTIIAMVPINTPDTLRTYKASGNPAGEVDKNGIFRRFLPKEVWEKFFTAQGLEIVDSKAFTNSKKSFGSWDMAVWTLKK